MSHLRGEGPEEAAYAQDMFETIFRGYRQEKDDYFSEKMQRDLIRLMHEPRIAYVSAGHLTTVLQAEKFGASAAPDQAGQSGGFAQADGNGEIHCYSWLDGVSAMLMRLEMKSYTELRTQKGLLELNFCANGRFETRFSLRDHVLLKPGDMAISCYDGVHGSRSESHFPLGYYEGICLEVDPERARRWIERNAPAFRVDFSALQQNLLGDKWYRCSQAGPRCEHVFRELYESAAYLDPAFLRLKVLELLMLLSSIPRGAGTDAYCSARQAELIRHIRDHLLTDREGYTSLSRLAAEHEMSVSHLQKLFKQIYGVPVYHYIKEYRLEQAAVELVRSARPVTEIAQDAGYDNASKFSACFKERYGVTPSQYRTDAKAKQSIGTKTE